MEAEKSTIKDKNQIKLHTVDNNLNIIKENFNSKSNVKQKPLSIERNIANSKKISNLTFYIKNPNKLEKCNQNIT